MLTTFFSDYGWYIDIIDILVVSFLTYRVLMFFADTRAMQLLRGVFIIAIFWVIARALNLRTMMWLMNRLLSAVLIAIPIVFQPELRRLSEGARPPTTSRTHTPTPSPGPYRTSSSTGSGRSLSFRRTPD